MLAALSCVKLGELIILDLELVKIHCGVRHVNTPTAIFGRIPTAVSTTNPVLLAGLVTLFRDVLGALGRIQVLLIKWFRLTARPEPFTQLSSPVLL